MIGALLLAAISYGNPVIFADYSDPDVIRVGSDYYLVASSFQCVPGLPILHSRDLAHWTLVNYAARLLPSPDFDHPQHGLIAFRGEAHEDAIRARAVLNRVGYQVQHHLLQASSVAFDRQWSGG